MSGIGKSTPADGDFLLAVRFEPAWDENEWAFYFINNTDTHIEKLLLVQAGYEWGDMGNVKEVNQDFGPVRPREFILTWRDDSDAAEVRIDLTFRLRTARSDETLNFEFPKLYRLRDNPEDVPLLGKARFLSRPLRQT